MSCTLGLSAMRTALRVQNCLNIIFQIPALFDEYDLFGMLSHFGSDLLGTNWLEFNTIYN